MTNTLISVTSVYLTAIVYGQKGKTMANNIKVGPFSIGSLIALIGAILGIIAVFLVWFDYSASLLFTTYKYNITGMGFLSESGLADGFYKYCPLIAFILAIIVAVLNILPLLKVNIDAKIINIGSIVLGLVMIVLVVIWGTAKIISGLDTTGFSYTGIGAWLMIAGGVLAAAGGAANMFLKN